MITGDGKGTNGRSRFEWERLGAFAYLIPVGIVIVLVDATSVLMEAQRDGRQLETWEPFSWEASSIVVLWALAPLIGRAIDRWPLRRESPAYALPIHAALTLPFSLAHVVAMVAIRKAIYALAGGNYDFTGRQGPLLTFIYEYRKDLVSYAAICAAYSFINWRADAVAHKAPASPQRIEIRDGGVALFLDPHDILRVEAAGNYVEFHTPTRTHLVRGTLAAWDTKLAPLGFVRAHRSRVINRARIRAIKPTPSGDLMLTLDDNSEIAASRRYRTAFETSVAA